MNKDGSRKTFTTAADDSAGAQAAWRITQPRLLLSIPSSYYKDILLHTREEEDGTTPVCSLSQTTTYVYLTFHDSVC